MEVIEIDVNKTILSVGDIIQCMEYAKLNKKLVKLTWDKRQVDISPTSTLKECIENVAQAMKE